MHEGVPPGALCAPRTTSHHPTRPECKMFPQKASPLRLTTGVAQLLLHSWARMAAAGLWLGGEHDIVAVAETNTLDVRQMIFSMSTMVRIFSLNFHNSRCWMKLRVRPQAQNGRWR